MKEQKGVTEAHGLFAQREQLIYVGDIGFEGVILSQIPSCPTPPLVVSPNVFADELIDVCEAIRQANLLQLARVVYRRQSSFPSLYKVCLNPPTRPQFSPDITGDSAE